MDQLTLRLVNQERYEIMSLKVSENGKPKQGPRGKELREIVARADNLGNYELNERKLVINSLTYAQKSAGFFTDPTFKMSFKEFVRYGRPLSFIQSTKVLQANDKLQ
tara:strand:+ start:3659 stop:3979 length:321 start_codon:yes stop_codon:yes gene_type:complete